MTRGVCVSSPILNDSCKAASPRCDRVRGQLGKQNAGVDGELHLGPKSGSLATSTSAPSVAGDVCDSLGAHVFESRGCWSWCRARLAGSALKGASSAKATSMARSSACSSPVLRRGSRVSISTCRACV